MIADINWLVFYSLIALGAVLTGVFTYFVATWRRPTGGRPELAASGGGAPAREPARTAAREQRRAA